MLCSAVLETHKKFSKMVSQYITPVAECKSLIFFHSLPNTWYSLPFHFSYFCVYIIMSHHNFNLHYGNEIEHVFMCLLVFFITFLAKHILKTFVCFSMIVFSFWFIAIIIFVKGTLITGKWRKARYRKPGKDVQSLCYFSVSGLSVLLGNTGMHSYFQPCRPFEPIPYLKNGWHWQPKLHIYVIFSLKLGLRKMWFKEKILLSWLLKTLIGKKKYRDLEQVRA